MRETQIVAAIAACLIGLSGCGDSTPAAATIADSGATRGGEGDAGIADAGMSTGGTDAGTVACADEPTTLGNDCPGVVTCGDAVDSCSLTTQNCCVKEYDRDAASCSDGSTCDGLAKATCDGPEDCTDGQQCCISVSVKLNSAEIKHRCVADVKSCSGGLIANSILCHTDADCAAGQGCDPIHSLPWWGICK
jgi:hypothetical protein